MVFIQPHLRRPNLTVKTGAHVQKILMDYTRATGVVYLDTNVEEAINVRLCRCLACLATLADQLLSMPCAPARRSFSAVELSSLPSC